MKRILLAATAVAVVSSAAMAADTVVVEPVASAYSWSGGYVGAQGGYAWSDSPFRNRSDGYVEAADFDPRGFLGGVYAGYNSQMANNMVLGIDADLNAANIESDGTEYTYSYDGGPSEVSSATPHSKMTWNGAVRARVGYAYDRFLPYVAGGVSFGEYKFDLIRSNGETIFSEKPTMTGWNIGAGVEYAATDNLILRAEYRYTDFGTKTFHELWGEDEGKIKLRTNDIRLGVAYKF